MFWNKNVLFCDINPTCYAISRQKEICKRHVRNFIAKKPYAKARQHKPLPVLLSNYSCNLIKRAKGVDLRLQENKAVNIELACRRINGTVIHPGEVFSFWHAVGKATKRKGYKDGRVIIGNKLRPGTGGGLCNLANTIHLLVLHSPLKVTEFHSHSDALAPDEGKRIPFSAGTSVNYNYIDYCFQNNTDQDVQLLVWCENERLYGELRSMRAFPFRYALTEEDHHFHKEGEKYYRISKIYKNTYDKQSGKLLDTQLVRDNHSEVMFDHSLIPEELIR